MIDWDRIESFIGFGRRDAPVVFIGMEEGRFRTRAEYTATMLPERTRRLRAVISESPRELVVCYGKVNWPEYQALFDEFAWRDDGDFRVGQGVVRVVLTPHFSGRAFNTDAQLERLAAVALRSGD